MLKNIMNRKFELNVLNEVFNYVKSPDVDFSLEAVKLFFDCASVNPN